MTPLRLTWLGHATVVLELDGTRVVTDPVLTRRVAHLWRSGPLPSLERGVDAVLVSHLHWDHLDGASLERFAPEAVLVVPAGAERLGSRLGFARVFGARSGDVLPIGGIEVAVTHAEHAASRRGGTRAEAVGYVLRGSQRIYFAGDTDLFDGMRELAGGLDLALLPIAGWGRTLPPGHLDAHAAVRALELLQPRHAVPIHWGTYAPFGMRWLGGSAAAAEDFRAEAATRVPEVAVHLLQVGASLEL